MKKATFLITTLLSLALFTNCSKNNDSSNDIKQKLIGEWLGTDPSTKPATNDSYTFSTDGKVVNRYYDTSSSSYISQTGTFSVSGDKLTMITSEGDKDTAKVAFITDKKVQITPDGKSKTLTWYKK